MVRVRRPDASASGAIVASTWTAELTGGDQHEAARSPRRRAGPGQCRDQGQGEGHGLAAAGPAPAEDVATGEGVGQRGGLDREGIVDAAGRKRGHEGGGDAEPGERGGGGRTDGRRRSGTRPAAGALPADGRRAAAGAGVGEGTGVPIMRRDGRGCWPDSRRGRMSVRRSRRPRRWQVPRTVRAVCTAREQTTPDRGKPNPPHAERSGPRRTRPDAQRMVSSQTSPTPCSPRRRHYRSRRYRTTSARAEMLSNPTQAAVSTTCDAARCDSRVWTMPGSAR